MNVDEVTAAWNRMMSQVTATSKMDEVTATCETDGVTRHNSGKLMRSQDTATGKIDVVTRHKKTRETICSQWEIVLVTCDRVSLLQL